MLRALARESRVCWDRLLFSAKEAVYKAWFPLAGRWLGFEDADRRRRPSGSGIFGAPAGAWTDGSAVVS